MKDIAGFASWKADAKLERRTKLVEDAELVCWKEDAKHEQVKAGLQCCIQWLI